MYKFGSLQQAEWQMMYDLAKMFLYCFNHWKLETPSVHSRSSPTDDQRTYKENYTRFRIYTISNTCTQWCLYREGWTWEGLMGGQGVGAGERWERGSPGNQMGSPFLNWFFFSLNVFMWPLQWKIDKNDCWVEYPPQQEALSWQLPSRLQPHVLMDIHYTPAHVTLIMHSFCSGGCVSVMCQSSVRVWQSWMQHSSLAVPSWALSSLWCEDNWWNDLLRSRIRCYQKRGLLSSHTFPSACMWYQYQEWMFYCKNEKNHAMHSWPIYVYSVHGMWHVFSER